MNKYEKIFFSKHIQEGNEVKYIVHEHIIVILNRLITVFILFVFIPLFFYIESPQIQAILPFHFLEIYLIFIYFKIIYDIFDWYNDAWIVTNDNIVSLEWALFYMRVNSVDFHSIEGIEVIQDGIFDKVLGKGILIVHKIGDEKFKLNEARIPFDALEEIEKIKEKKQNEPEEKEKEKFELILEALSGVVNEYLNVNGRDKEILDKQLDEILEKKGTLDLR